VPTRRKELGDAVGTIDRELRYKWMRTLPRPRIAVTIRFIESYVRLYEATQTHVKCLKTSFHGGNAGSNPAGDATFQRYPHFDDTGTIERQNRRPALIDKWIAYLIAVSC